MIEKLYCPACGKNTKQKKKSVNDDNLMKCQNCGCLISRTTLKVREKQTLKKSINQEK